MTATTSEPAPFSLGAHLVGTSPRNLLSDPLREHFWNLLHCYWASPRILLRAPLRPSLTGTSAPSLLPPALPPLRSSPIRAPGGAMGTT